MKPVLLALILSATTIWAEPKAATRQSVIDGVEYKFSFFYDDSWATVPATLPEGCLHYNARIFVRGGGTDEEFTGQYTHGECYEDKSEALVAQAKRQAQSRATRALPALDVKVEARDSVPSTVGWSGLDVRLVTVMGRRYLVFDNGNGLAVVEVQESREAPGNTCVGTNIPNLYVTEPCVTDLATGR